MHSGKAGKYRADLGALGDRPVDSFRKPPHLVDRNVAGNQEDRIGGRVIFVVEADRILARQAGDLVRPADDRRAIRAVEKQSALDDFRELGARLVADAHAPLFLDDFELGQNHLVGQDEIGHPVRLIGHDHFQRIGGNLLVIAGIVVRRESVLLTADLGDLFRELACRIGFRSLEHQMF